MACKTCPNNSYIISFVTAGNLVEASIKKSPGPNKETRKLLGTKASNCEPAGEAVMGEKKRGGGVNSMSLPLLFASFCSAGF